MILAAWSVSVIYGVGKVIDLLGGFNYAHERLTARFGVVSRIAKLRKLLGQAA